MASAHQARSEKLAAKEAIQALGGKVVGLGLMRVSGADYAIKVNLSKCLPTRVVVPKEINGVPLRIEVTGEVRALQE